MIKRLLILTALGAVTFLPVFAQDTEAEDSGAYTDAMADTDADEEAAADVTLTETEEAAKPDEAAADVTLTETEEEAEPDEAAADVTLTETEEAAKPDEAAADVTLTETKEEAAADVTLTETEEEEAEPDEAAADVTLTETEEEAEPSDDDSIPDSIRYNRWYRASERYTKLAKEAYDEGDYDLSEEYSAKAIENAALSDAYVARMLKMREADETIAAARARFEWAEAQNAAQRFPESFAAAQSGLSDAGRRRGEGDFDGATAAARGVLEALALVTEEIVLPAKYRVQPWAISRDCFWNIAGRAWAYGDATKWRILYNANKSKLPNPSNPDIIRPGTVLDIPSIKGEIRRGFWEAGRTYTPLR
ncbi:MAG: hypothetical protein LBR16_04920 [Treponema sp.]|jgi:nucleoid-associated protein YgaU|nr:hypothetical protein [Treponema sp.]